jgi:hypothetical protein
MRIATYNVNGINARLPVLLRWLAEARPEVVCLQELKAPQEKFPQEALREAGYHPIWHGQKSWNGVALLARGQDPVETARGLAGDSEDVQSRYIEGTVGGVRVGCLYLPNGNPAPGPKFDYKLRWFDRLAAHAAALVARPEPVVLAGDYNVIPEEIDVYRPESWVDDPVPAGVPESIPRTAGPGVDGRDPPPAPGRPGVYLLGLHALHLAPQRWAADRPSAAQRRSRPPAGRGWGGPGSPRVGPEQRPRPRLGRASRRLTRVAADRISAFGYRNSRFRGRPAPIREGLQQPGPET